ncbi:MAG: efflux RND transporter periplasmic adaptor subunit, partial [Gammaproteobacteria bacterium]|nr:efflux RND transporter periplasmic adaptor subunit [Gammaproteobacteria bacterium]
MSEPGDRPSLEGLRIPRDEQPPESRLKRFLWPSIGTVCVVGVLALLAAWFWPDSATAVRVETVSSSSAGAAASVLDASGYVTARRAATVSSQ